MSRGLRSLVRSWTRTSVRRVVDFAAERLEEIRDELDDPSILDADDFLLTPEDPPSGLDVDKEQPSSSWIPVDLVDAKGDYLVHLKGSRHPEDNPVELVLPEVLPFEIPSVVRLMGFQIRSLRQLSSTPVTGLVQDLRLKEDGPSVLLHSGYERMQAYRKIRALLNYPDTLIEQRSDVRLRVAAIGSGDLIFTGTVFLQAI